jgi:hypothetical protein
MTVKLSPEDKLRSELAIRQGKLSYLERMVKEAAPRSRFAYAASATKQRRAIWRLENELALYDRAVR